MLHAKDCTCAGMISVKFQEELDASQYKKITNRIEGVTLLQIRLELQSSFKTRLMDRYRALSADVGEISIVILQLKLTNSRAVEHLTDNSLDIQAYAVKWQ